MFLLFLIVVSSVLATSPFFHNITSATSYPTPRNDIVRLYSVGVIVNGQFVTEQIVPPTKLAMPIHSSKSHKTFMNIEGGELGVHVPVFFGVTFYRVNFTESGGLFSAVRHIEDSVALNLDVAHDPAVVKLASDLGPMYMVTRLWSARNFIEVSGDSMTTVFFGTGGASVFGEGAQLERDSSGPFAVELKRVE